jgi:SAM-dependent methyltransferase
MLNLAEQYLPYYAERAGEEDRARQVGWRDRCAQHARFRQFARAIGHSAEADFTVADVGCGLGDLLPFLRSAGFTGLRYTGYDIIPGMVEAAAASHADSKAAFRVIGSVEEIEQTDYSFASGIFNAKAGHSDEAWWAHIQACVEAMAAKSGCRVAFNMLSSYSDEEKRDASLYYADPCRVFDWCKREIAPDVALLHDYGHWDFTVLLTTGEAGRRNGTTS